MQIPIKQKDNPFKRPGFYIAWGCIFIIIFLLIFIPVSCHSRRHPKEPKSRQKNVSATIIFEESLVASKGIAEVIPLYQDGCTVSEDEPVCEVHLDGYSIELDSSYEELNSRLDNEILNTFFSDVSDPELDKLQEKCTAALETYTELVRTDPSGNECIIAGDNLNDCKNKLSAYIRRDLKLYCRRSDTVKQLVAFLDEIEQQKDDLTTTVNAPSNGIISYHIDGFSIALSGTSPESITRRQLKDAENYSPLIDNEYTALFRLVSSDRFFLAVSKKNINLDNAKGSIYVEFDGNEYESEIIGNENGLYILEIDSSPLDFINARDININIRYKN